MIEISKEVSLKLEKMLEQSWIDFQKLSEEEQNKILEDYIHR